MNHQLFENWLLSEESLSAEDAEALEAHLKTCNQCQELNNAWSSVRQAFETVPEIEPPTDFATRWSERLMAERQIALSIRHRWQSMIMLILLSNVIAGLVFLLGTQFLTTFKTPTELILSLVYRLAAFVTFANGAQNLFTTLFRTLTSIVPAGMWVVLAVGLIGSGAIWIISMKSLSVLPRRT